MRLRSLLAAAAIALAPAVLLPPVASAEPAIYTGAFDDLAVKGAKEFSTTWMGAEFRFASAANRDAFKKNPEAYAPQYGGYCAWAVSQGYTAKGDARNWKIVDGKLYLNYNTSVQKKWEGDIPGFIASADANWPEVLN